MEPQIGDAHGAALLAHLEGDDGAHVIERDDGLVEPMNAAVYFAEPADWPLGEAIVLDHVRGSVLDIGAGAGRYGLALEASGHGVLSLDVSPGAAEVCRRRGLSRVFSGSIFDLDESGFDTFLLAGHNLGLLESPDHSRRFLERLSELARAGARIVGTNRDPYETSDESHLEYHRMNRARGREPGQARLRVRHRRLATDWFDYWFQSRQELATVAEARWWQLTAHEPLFEGSYLAVLERHG